MNKHELEERFIKFSVSIVKISENINKSKAGNHLSGQIIRSGTSVALNYGEARSAESRKDFIHKLKIVLKELRETNNCLRILYHAKLYTKNNINTTLKECHELTAIIVRSIETAKKILNSLFLNHYS